MLPQMMPLPWLSTFASIFLCFFSVSAYYSYFLLDKDVAHNKFLAVPSLRLDW